MDKQIELERWAIAESLSKNFHINGEGWDASDFEWAAHCLQMDGYRKASDVAREIFEEIEDIRLREIHRCEIIREKEQTHTQRNYWEGGANALRQLTYKLAELKKKYESEGEE